MYFDIHTHILPIDDGAKSLEESLTLLKMQLNQNVKKIILTPHFNHPRKTKLTITEIIKCYNDLKELIKRENFDIEIFLGSEILYRSNLSTLLKDNQIITMNNTNYILLEFDFYNEEEFDEIAYICEFYKYKPIIAHPERYEYINNVKDIEYIKSLGFLIQVNSTSFNKNYRKNKLVQKLLSLKLIDFIASDCHDIESRKPNLEDTFNKLKTKKNEAYLNTIFFENPKLLGL